MGSVFISHSSADHELASEVCSALEAAGLPCWVAPRNIRPGANYAEAIIEGISGSATMVLILTRRSNESPEVLREVERASNKGLPIIAMRFGGVELSRGLEYFLSARQWFDVSGRPLSESLGELAEVVSHARSEGPPPYRPAVAPPREPRAPRGEGIRKALAAAAVVLTAAVARSAVVLTAAAARSADAAKRAWARPGFRRTAGLVTVLIALVTTYAVYSAIRWSVDEQQRKTEQRQREDEKRHEAERLVEEAANDADLEKLQGTWNSSENTEEIKKIFYVNENKLNAYDYVKQPFLGSTERNLSFSIRLGATSRPKSIDLLRVDEKGTEHRQLGIYEIAGDVLTVNLAASGQPRPRFLNSSGAGQFRRKK